MSVADSSTNKEVLEQLEVMEARIMSTIGSRNSELDGFVTAGLEVHRNEATTTVGAELEALLSETLGRPVDVRARDVGLYALGNHLLQKKLMSSKDELATKYASCCEGVEAESRNAQLRLSHAKRKCAEIKEQAENSAAEVKELKMQLQESRQEVAWLRKELETEQMNRQPSETRLKKRNSLIIPSVLDVADEHRIKGDTLRKQAALQDIDPVGKLSLYEAALEEYNRALSNKDFSLAHYGRGVALRKMHKHDEAVEAFEKAIEQDPQGSGATGEPGAAQYNLGLTLLQLGRISEAQKAYAHAVQINDQNPKFAKGLDRCMNLEKDAFLQAALLEDNIQPFLDLNIDGGELSD